MIKYLTGGWGNDINKVEVVRQTKKSVWILQGLMKVERRQARTSEYDQYHDSWAEAHAYLMLRSERKILAVQAQLDNLERHHRDLCGMLEQDCDVQ